MKKDFTGVDFFKKHNAIRCYGAEKVSSKIV